MANPIVGTGVLVLDKARHPGAEYRITVTPFGDSRLRADGVLSLPADAHHVVLQAMAATYANLELEGGEVIQIVVTRVKIPSDVPSFEFAAAGPLPGFRD